LNGVDKTPLKYSVSRLPPPNWYLFDKPLYKSILSGPTSDISACDPRDLCPDATGIPSRPLITPPEKPPPFHLGGSLHLVAVGLSMRKCNQGKSGGHYHMHQMQSRIKLAMRHTWTTARPPNCRLPLSPMHEKKRCPELQASIRSHLQELAHYCRYIKLKTNYALG
jgi:hypothetical protein